ncbi:cation diffusion facilitator family transporter [Sinanaerobacter sp. ZZT-01]|uniref:cation diffusion facilitator family transporter n=1 Tax=Sinanaerobacter sp. ZZT-01 TaxID=3111540 RepID=UPI002D78C17F|nr:cation diffusion facilitator family transporter [Sinanaerobacter sp. ZZT-01]WRR93789.1 cation diffusion facilitator family transporter [Sinanaerobacter sp. ZZT-01]
MVSLLIRLLIKDYENIASQSVQKSYAKLCSAIGILLNTLLFTVKLFSGLISGSTAIITDGFNNLADAVTSIASFLGFCLAGIGSGENHLFGHGRYEWLMGFLSALAVLVMGTTLAKNSITSIRIPQNIEFSWMIVFLLICSILVKLYMFFYNKNIACKINSSAMKATASDCISDMAATTAIMISLIVQYFTGWKIDGWCGLLVSFFIMFSGLKSMMEIVERLLGQTPDKDLVDKITTIIMQYSQVKGINSLIIHDYGLGHYVASMHIEGEEENSAILSDIANEISYKLYLQMDCDTTIQIDYLDTDPVLYDLIYKKAEQEIQKFEANGKIKSLRIVKSGLHKNVLFIISGSRKLQKKQDQVRVSINQSILSVNSNCRVITKIVIAALHSKK